MLGEIRGKDKTRSLPSDGFKAATCTVAEECMGRAYIRAYIHGNQGSEVRMGQRAQERLVGKVTPRKAGRTRPGCSGKEGSDYMERDPQELLAKDESFS